MPLSYSIILTILVTGAMASDISHNRICNIWLLPAAVTGISVRLYDLIISSITHKLFMASGFIVYLIVAVILYLLCLMNGLGAGDVKLILTCSLFLTGQEMLISIAAAFIAAGMMAVMLMADRSAGRIKNRIKERITAGSADRHPALPSLPFAVPYGIAVILLIGGMLQPEML